MRRPDWLNKLLDRRRSLRVPVEHLSAVYWTGSIATPRKVHEVSSHGACIETTDRWYAGTLLQIVFHHERRVGQSDEVEMSRTVWARVVRASAGAICVEYVFRSKPEANGFLHFLKNVAEGRVC